LTIFKKKHEYKNKCTFFSSCSVKKKIFFKAKLNKNMHEKRYEKYHLMEIYDIKFKREKITMVIFFHPRKRKD